MARKGSPAGGVPGEAHCPHAGGPRTARPSPCRQSPARPPAARDAALALAEPGVRAALRREIPGKFLDRGFAGSVVEGSGEAGGVREENGRTEMRTITRWMSAA